MCGIAGFYGSKDIEQSRIAGTLALMKHRGPDAQASRSYTCGSSHILLLHARLSIIDLDQRSNQPFEVPDVALSFNGEIYNFVELRKDLEKIGCELRTQSDTEVLAHAFRQKGEQCEETLEGMWAFAALNKKTGMLLLSRDRFGEKPLYILRTHEGIYFASEVKFLAALSGKTLTINKEHVSRFLLNGFRSLYQHKDQWFEGVEEIPSGCHMILTPDDAPKLTRYWEPPKILPESWTFEESVEHFRAALMRSIQLRLRSDVPLAFCLSGGVDSSSIISIAAKTFGAKVAAYSVVDEDPRYDEEQNIRQVIDDLKCPWTAVRTSPHGFFERLSTLIRYHDGPLATISYYVHSMLSEAINRDGFRVAFSGTGADELVTGYYDHFLLHLAEMHSEPDAEKFKDDWRKWILPLVRNPSLQDPDLYLKHPDFREHFFDGSDRIRSVMLSPVSEQFLEENYHPIRLRNRLLNEMLREVVPVILREDDLNSMFYSIENRSPFLDTGLLAVAMKIPIRHLIKDGYQKAILREAVKGIIPDGIRLDRKKVGFNASINSFINFADPKTREYLLSDNPIFELVDRAKVSEFFQTSTDNSVSKFLFNFVNCRIFFEQWG